WRGRSAHGSGVGRAARGGRPATPLWLPADFGSLRLHAGAATPWPRYGRAALRSWVQRVIDAFGEDVPVFVYFNNDQEGAAPVDAAAFADLCSDVLAPMPWRRPSSS